VARALFAAAAAGAVLAGRLLAADGPPAWRIARADVRVVCPLTVGGSFEARTSSLTGALGPPAGSPMTLGGEVAVDLKTLDTGIGLRNEHMRTEYLEVGKGQGFDTAVLSDIRLGDATSEGFQGRTRFTGTLLLHGTKKEIAGQADIRREGAGTRADASFPVVLADFGIATPRYLGVGVKNEVQVKVSLVAAPAPASGPR
jgi:polyisoprenoid-binding protein YceI